nr:MAG: hypothetical protein DIU57_01910 [Pseudomonadota bacterium]
MGSSQFEYESVMMRNLVSAGFRAATGLMAILLPITAAAADPESGKTGHSGPTCSCPDLRTRPAPNAGNPLANFSLNDIDEIATLNALHIGLTEVPDGGNFVWQRSHGRLSGSVRPVFSFKKSNGEVCRHVIVTLRSGHMTRTVEGAACRGPDGRWVLEG